MTCPDFGMPWSDPGLDPQITASYENLERQAKGSREFFAAQQSLTALLNAKRERRQLAWKEAKEAPPNAGITSGGYLYWSGGEAEVPEGSGGGIHADYNADE